LIGALRICCPPPRRPDVDEALRRPRQAERANGPHDQLDGRGPDDPSRTPYGLYDAAAAVGYRRGAARELAKSEVFVATYSDAVKAANNNQPAPNPCSSLALVRAQEAWRVERNQLIAQSVNLKNRLNKAYAELAALRAQQPAPVAFVRPASAGCVIRRPQGMSARWLVLTIYPPEPASG
jgi:hypothetical protein